MATRCRVVSQRGKEEWTARDARIRVPIVGALLPWGDAVRFWPDICCYKRGIYIVRRACNSAITCKVQCRWRAARTTSWRQELESFFAGSQILIESVPLPCTSTHPAIPPRSLPISRPIRPRFPNGVSRIIQKHCLTQTAKTHQEQRDSTELQTHISPSIFDI